MATIKDLEKVLKVEKGNTLTLDQVQKAKEIYISISQEGYKSKEWTKTNLALAMLNNAFIELLKSPEVKDLSRSIFINDKGGYNVNLAQKTEKGFEQVLSVKFKSSDTVETLINDYDFYLHV